MKYLKYKDKSGLFTRISISDGQNVEELAAIYADDIDGNWEVYDDGKIEEKSEIEKLKNRYEKIIKANNKQLQLLEDCIVEMAGIVYADDNATEPQV